MMKRPSAKARAKKIEADEVADSQEECAIELARRQKNELGITVPPAMRSYFQGNAAWGQQQVNSLRQWCQSFRSKGGDAGKTVVAEYEKFWSKDQRIAFATKLKLINSFEDSEIFQEESISIARQDELVGADDLSYYDVLKLLNVPPDAPPGHIGKALKHIDREQDDSKPDGFQYRYVKKGFARITDTRANTLSVFQKAKGCVQDWDPYTELMDRDSEGNVAVGSPKKKTRKSVKANVSIEELPLDDAQKEAAQSEINKATCLKHASSAINAIIKVLTEDERMQEDYESVKEQLMAKSCKEYESSKAALIAIKGILDLAIPKMKAMDKTDFKSEEAGPRKHVVEAKAALAVFRQREVQIQNLMDMG